MNSKLKYISMVITVAAVVICFKRYRDDTPTHSVDPTLEELKSQDPRVFSAESLQKLNRSADKGDGYAAWTLFHHYEFNHNPLARGCLIRAAELGVPEAQFSYYAFLIQSPNKVIRESSVDWLRKAAEQGFEPAIEGLKRHEEYLKNEPASQPIKRE